MTIRAGSFPRRRALLVAALTASLGLGGCGNDDDTDAGQPEPEIERKALVIGIDGLMYDYIDQEDTPELNEPSTPNFASFTLTKAVAGGLMNTETHQNSSSGPSWSSILTGNWADRHGVASNNDAPVASPSIYSRLKALAPELDTGSFAAWTPINAGHLLKEMPHIDRRIDGASRPDGESVDDFITDQLVLELEDDSSSLDFIFAHLDEVDGAGHNCGWCTLYEETLVATDNRLGRILAAVERREQTLDEQWLVMIVSDHGHRQNGGHGGDSIAERTSVIGVNRPELFNEFFRNPAEPLPLTEDEEQNSLMGYPGITAIVPSVMSYFGHPPQRMDYLDSPSLIGHLGAYKLYSETLQSDSEQARITLNWQLGSEVTEQAIYRNGEHLADLSSQHTSYQDTVTLDDLGEGSHELNYTVEANIGAPVSTLSKVHLSEPVSLADLIAERESLASFDSTLAPFSWVSEGSATPSYAAGPFAGVNALNLQRSQGYASLSRDFSSTDQFAFGFHLKLNGDLSSDPNLISNKDWASGVNPGFTLAVRNDAAIRLNLGDGSNRADTSWTSVAKNEWVFVVVSMDLVAKEAALYVQDSTDGFRSARTSTGDVSSLAAPYPLNIGEGGDGDYNLGNALNFDIADLITFDRPLTEAEARALAGTSAPFSSL